MSDRTPDEILAYCEKATAGPWYCSIGGISSDAPGRGICDQPWGDNVDANTDFICNAREDLPQLALRVKELETKLAIAVEALKDASAGGCIRPFKTACVDEPGLDTLEWCAACIAYKALEDS